jgi:hypothetical protein
MHVDKEDVIDVSMWSGFVELSEFSIFLGAVDTAENDDFRKFLSTI